MGKAQSRKCETIGSQSTNHRLPKNNKWVRERVAWTHCGSPSSEPTHGKRSSLKQKKSASRTDGAIFYNVVSEKL
jgi:hypothetical protein